MKIWLVDEKVWFNITYDEAKLLIASDLHPTKWTRENIQPYLLFDATE